jgi:hypothetical protein
MVVKWRPSLPVCGAVIALSMLLAGCGGGTDEDKSSAKSAPSPDYDEAHDAIAKLSDAYNAVAQADVAAQQAAVTYFKSKPTGPLDDPAITQSQQKLTDAFEKRDQLRDGLADLTALEDPDVEKAYDAFIEKAKEQDSFNDSYYTAFPAYRTSLDRCLDVFQVASRTPGTSSPTAYGRMLLNRHDVAAKDCVDVLTGLSDSENPLMHAYAADSLTSIQKRRAVLQQLAGGQVSISAATDRFVSTTKEFNRNLDKNTAFTQEMTRVNAREEFIALSQVVDSKQKAS